MGWFKCVFFVGLACVTPLRLGRGRGTAIAYSLEKTERNRVFLGLGWGCKLLVIAWTLSWDD